MPNLESFGERFKIAMKKSGYTQKELSTIWKINENSITRYIKGDRQPKIDLLEEICDTLKISVEWLVTGKENYTELNEEEQKLLTDFRNCSLEIQNVIRAAAASGAAAPDTAASAQIQSGNLSSSKTG